MLDKSNLRPWQTKACDQLVAAGSLLFGAQPGSGKTVTTLTAATHWRAAGTTRILLVAPRVILDSVWQQEAARWSHTAGFTFDMAHQYSGADREHLWFEGAGFFVTCTPDTLHKLVDRIAVRMLVPFDRVVVDESQLFKNPGAVRTRALLAITEILETSQ